MVWRAAANAQSTNKIGGGGGGVGSDNKKMKSEDAKTAMAIWQTGPYMYQQHWHEPYHEEAHRDVI